MLDIGISERSMKIYATFFESLKCKLKITKENDTTDQYLVLLPIFEFSQEIPIKHQKKKKS